ncbi:MAG: DNA polymerase III subunit beta [Anaerolineae bacterium]|nr:DNA polymerase III subunit beta [Anaerolineae bacterium]
MRTSCLQENLSRGLSVVGRAVASRPTLPVLSHILLATDQSQLKLAATDLELFIVCWIGARVEEEGAITVPARLFVDLINSLPQERVDLTLKDQMLHLSCARNEADINGIDAQEFPLLPTPSEEQQIMLEPDLLRQMVAQVVFAAATDESRPILTGVLARFEENTLTMAAADGFRLSVRQAQIPERIAQPMSVVIPAKALNELARISGDEQDPIGLSITPARSQVLFHLQGDSGANEGRIFGIDLVSQLIEGNFVNYRQIIPTSHTTRTIMNTEDLLKACKTANIFARSEANVVHLEIAPGADLGSGTVKMTATSTEMGDSIGELDASVEGEALTIAFNVRFLIDVLSVLDSAQVVLETSSPGRPGVIRPLGSEDFVHVIMPMHIRGR